MNEQRNWDVYPGKRKGYNWLTFAAVVVALCVAALVLTFSSFQKYLVYRQDGVHLRLPFIESSYEELDDLDGIVREPVQAQLVLDGFDFSTIETDAGEGVNIMKAMYVTYDQINDEALENYVSRAKLNNAKSLVLQVKPESGMLVYPSETDFAQGYGLCGNYDLKNKVLQLKERGYYLVADVTCLLDSTIISRYMGTTLTAQNGAVLTTEAGYWMDPYSPEYRQYLVDVCKELIYMGFNEIMFSYMSHPVAESVRYTQQMTQQPTPEAAISSFAIHMERELGDLAPIGLRVSAEALNNGVGSNGQDMKVLGKVFDRIYCSSTSNTYQSDLDKALGYMNTTDTDRFVPYGYSAPTDNSWMLLTWVDTEADD